MFLGISMLWTRLPNDETSISERINHKINQNSSQISRTIDELRQKGKRWLGSENVTKKAHHFIFSVNKHAVTRP